MISKVLLPLLLLLESASSDRLRFHLENLVDRNISACDDFYHHACSQQANPEEFFRRRFQSIFEDAMGRLQADAVKNSPIEHDLNEIKNRDDSFEDNDYERLARERCKDEVLCYRLDQMYYGNFLGGVNKMLVRNTPTTSNETSEETISNIIFDTSEMINRLITFPRYLKYSAGGAISFHTTLNTRLRMIEFMKSNSTYGDFHSIEGIGEIMKNRMVDAIKSSPWLGRGEMGQFILQMIVDRVSSIQVFHDFDELDKNITTLQKLNRDFNRLYYSDRRRTGVHGLDTLLGLHDTFNHLKLTSSPEISLYIERVMENFVFNAYFDSDNKAVTLFAPYLYRPAFDSTILKEPVITYATLGHELYHSLFAPDNKILIDMYGHRSQCIIDHYQRSCTKFAQDECMSGHHTITEDGADLEGLRLAYTFIRENYSDDELACSSIDWFNSAIDGLETTLDQSFFYYAASEFCEKDRQHNPNDPHSSGVIRVNAAYSLMPEFTKAFGCTEGDAMYVKEKDSCYVFGPNS